MIGCGIKPEFPGMVFSEDLLQLNEYSLLIKVVDGIQTQQINTVQLAGVIKVIKNCG